jgi:hypothetical protein
MGGGGHLLKGTEDKLEWRCSNIVVSLKILNGPS